MNMVPYPDFITREEGCQILECLRDKEYTKEKTRVTYNGETLIVYKNKNLDLELEDGCVAKIITPKIMKLVGRLPKSSALLESHHPFGLHVDTVTTFVNKDIDSECDFPETNLFFDNLAFLIPLTEDKDQQTILFDFYSDDLDLDRPKDKLPYALPTPVYDGVHDLGNLDSEDRHLLHHYNITVSDCFTWKIGHAFTWPRNQLHCAGKYFQSDLKQALVLFF